MRLASWAAAATVACMASAAYADTDVPALIKLVEAQPEGMDRATWREQRRDAAKKLGQSKDRRAVPVLIEVADKETFDVVGEIAIEALGALGDPQAVPELQKIAADALRDAHQRELAKKALAKLGAKATPPAAPTPAPEPVPAAPEVAPIVPKPAAPQPEAGSAAAAIDEGSLLGAQSAGPAADLPPLPVVDSDALAASDRITFAAGDATLAYDTVRKRVDFDGDLGGTWSHRIERPAFAYGWDGSVAVTGGYIDPQGAATSRGAQLVATGDGEVRGYHGALYGVAKTAVSAQEDYVSAVDNNGNTIQKTTTFEGDAQVALGVGYGRVLDVGARIRVRRLAAALTGNRALGKPIDAALARRLQLTWWALRGERTPYRALLATVAILREAGVLLGEPDAGTTYELLNVLRDTQLYARPVGFDVQLAIGEGYLQRPDMTPSEHGRIEQALALANYGKELDDDKVQLVGGGFARTRLFVSAGTPAPWAIGASAAASRYFYGAHGDPIGALDASVALTISDDDVPGGDPGLGVTSALGFTYWMNQASGLRLAATATVDQSQLFLGAQFSATYGLLDGTFAR